MDVAVTSLVRLPARFLATTFVAVLLYSWPALGAEYSLEYGLESRGTYRDNVGMSTNRSVDITGLKLSLPATLRVRDSRYVFNLAGKAEASRYDESGYDSDDGELKGNYIRLFERGQLSANASYIKASTRDTAFFDNGEVGFSASRVTRSSIGGSFLYAFSEKNSLTGNASYRLNEYANPRFRDGKLATSYIGVTHKMTDRFNLQARVTGTAFENDATIKAETLGLGGQLGFGYQPTEKLEMNLLAGILNSNTKYSTPVGFAPREDNDNRGYLVTGNLEYRGEVSRLTASLSSNASDNGNGYLVQSSTLRTSYRYSLSELTTLTLDGLSGFTSALDDRINNDRFYAQGGVTAEHRLTEHWRISARYRYRYQDRERQNGHATENTVSFSIIFRPDKKLWSG